MSAYANQSLVENTLQRSLTTQELAILASVIEAASEAINAYTNRKWINIDLTTDDVTEETRLYDGNGKPTLFIDDFMSISEFKISDVIIASSAYLLYPLNSEWKNSVHYKSSCFPIIRGGIEVTGLFYTGLVPSEVQLATATLVGLMFSSSRNIGDFKKESIEGYSYEILAGAEKTAQQKSVFDQLDYWRKVRI